jgi:hypothetical protein
MLHCHHGLPFDTVEHYRTRLLICYIPIKIKITKVQFVPECTQHPHMFFALSVFLIVPNVFDGVNNIDPRDSTSYTMQS